MKYNGKYSLGRYLLSEKYSLSRYLLKEQRSGADFEASVAAAVMQKMGRKDIFAITAGGGRSADPDVQIWDTTGKLLGAVECKKYGNNSVSFEINTATHAHLAKVLDWVPGKRGMQALGKAPLTDFKRTVVDPKTGAENEVVNTLDDVNTIVTNWVNTETKPLLRDIRTVLLRTEPGMKKPDKTRPKPQSEWADSKKPEYEKYQMADALSVKEGDLKDMSRVSRQSYDYTGGKQPPWGKRKKTSWASGGFSRGTINKAPGDNVRAEVVADATGGSGPHDHYAAGGDTSKIWIAHFASDPLSLGTKVVDATLLAFGGLGGDNPNSAREGPYIYVLPKGSSNNMTGVPGVDHVDANGTGIKANPPGGQIADLDPEGEPLPDSDSAPIPARLPLFGQGHGIDKGELVYVIPRTVYRRT
jgi:hypothetical protein